MPKYVKKILMEHQRPSAQTKSAFRNFNFRFWSITNHMLQTIFIIDRMVKVYPKEKGGKGYGVLFKTAVKQK